MAGITKKPVTETETISFKEASDRRATVHVAYMEVYMSRQWRQYAGVSTDKCTVRVKSMHWES